MSGRRKTRLIAMAILAVGGLIGSAVPLAGAARATTGALHSRLAPPPTSAAPLPLTCDDSVPGTRSCVLSANADTVLIDGTPYPVWAFDTTAPDNELPGPVLVMQEGETLEVTLDNNLPAAAGNLSLSIPASAAAPDAVGIADPDAATTYTFAGLEPGTYLYQAGPTLNAPRQIAMGLTGTLIVRPAAFDYGDEITWGFDAELPILVSEIDPAFNAAPDTFDMGFFNPSLFLINGEAYPDTSNIPLSIDEHNVLIHYVNGGVRDRSLGVLNARGDLLALNSIPIPVADQQSVSVQPLRAGEVADVLVHMPVDGGEDGAIDVALLDYGRALHNGSEAGAQGMLALIRITGLGGSPAGPYPNNVTLDTGQAETDVTNGMDDIIVTATFDVTLDAPAEFFVDDIGTSGAGVACAAGDPAICTVPAADVGLLLNGEHVVWVHGQNADGWGFVTGATFTVDKLGPTITGITMTPAIYNGTNPVRIGLTADSTITGTGTAIQEVRWALDAAPTPTSDILCSTPGPEPDCTGNNQAVVAVPGDITLPPTVEGTHTLQFIALDSVNVTGNWSIAPAVHEFVADATGPVTTITTTVATNGAAGYPDAVRVDADIVDALSNVADGEWWVDDPNTPGIDDPGVGNAHQVTAVDALWGDETTEQVYLNIPLGDVVNNPAVPGVDNDVTVYLRGQDGGGNWGAADSAGFDPTDTMAPQLTAGSGEVLGAINIAVFDPGVIANGVTAAEWFVGLPGPDCTTGAPAEGGATAITLVPAGGSVGNGPASGTFTALPPVVPFGSTLCVRASDGVGNWNSPINITSAAPDVTPPVVVATQGAAGSGVIDVYAYDPNDGGLGGVATLEYFVGVDPGPGNGIAIAFVACPPVIPGASETVCGTITGPSGTTVNFRAIDPFGNSSVVVETAP